MSYQSKRTRAVYTLLAMLTVMLPMSGWYARSLLEPPAAKSMQLVMRAQTPVCTASAVYMTNIKVDANAVRH